MNATQLSLDETFLSRLRKDDIRYLIGPIVYSLGGWDAGPCLSKLVPAARVALLAAGERELATLEEALIYLASASMEAPLHHENANTMFWLAQQILPRHPEMFPVQAPIWEILGHDQPFEMTDYLRQQCLDPLRRKIRAAVVRNCQADIAAFRKKILEVSPCIANM